MRKVHEELIWAAGFFDGEGSICLSSKGIKQYKRLVLSINQSISVYEVPHEPPYALLRFYEALGKIGSLRLLNLNSPFNAKPAWNWQTNSFAESQAIIVKLWDWLSPVKKYTAIEGLERMKGYYSTVKNFNNHGRRYRYGDF